MEFCTLPIWSSAWLREYWFRVSFGLFIDVFTVVLYPSASLIDWFLIRRLILLDLRGRRVVTLAEHKFFLWGEVYMVKLGLTLLPLWYTWNILGELDTYLSTICWLWLSCVLVVLNPSWFWFLYGAFLLYVKFRASLRLSSTSAKVLTLLDLTLPWVVSLKLYEFILRNLCE